MFFYTENYEDIFINIYTLIYTHRKISCNMQHTAAQCSSLQHNAAHCSTMQHAAAQCSTMQHAAPHCNTLQQTVPHCNVRQHTATHCNTLQHTATHCNTLQHIDIHTPEVTRIGGRVWEAKFQHCLLYCLHHLRIGLFCMSTGLFGVNVGL